MSSEFDCKRFIEYGLEYSYHIYLKRVRDSPVFIDYCKKNGWDNKEINDIKGIDLIL